MGKTKRGTKKAQPHSTTPKRKAVKRPACCNVPKSTRGIGTKPDGGKHLVGVTGNGVCESELPWNETGIPGVIGRDAAQVIVNIPCPVLQARVVLCCENGTMFWGAAP